MERRIAEQSTGEGLVYRKDGSFVANVKYALQVIQEFIDTTTKDGPGTLPGLKDVVGRVTGLDTFALLSEGAELTLHLEDGRRLDFLVKNLDGQIAAQGSLYEPPA